MLAVLADALDLVLQETAPAATPRALLQRKAAAWIRVDGRVSLFSFLNICETLGLDANRLRVNVARLVERGGHAG